MILITMGARFMYNFSIRRKLMAMAGEMWSTELTDWQRASFCVKENSPPSKLDALRMKLAQLELECLKKYEKLSSSADLQL